MFASFYLILLLNFTQTAPSDLRQMRDKYHQAIYKEVLAKELIAQLKQKPTLTAIEKAYLGATQMLMAQYAFLPNQKLSWFSNGKSNLEEAIRVEPKNAESIYLEIKKIKDKNLQDRIKLFLQKEASLTEQERLLLP
jgi:hypothetical protein